MHQFALIRIVCSGSDRHWRTLLSAKWVMRNNVNMWCPIVKVSTFPTITHVSSSTLRGLSPRQCDRLPQSTTALSPMAARRVKILVIMPICFCVSQRRPKPVSRFSNGLQQTLTEAPHHAFGLLLCATLGPVTEIFTTSPINTVQVQPTICHAILSKHLFTAVRTV